MRLKDIAHCRGLGPQLLIGVDSKSEPGKMICHFVRMETIVFQNDGTFDTTTFQMADPVNDLRLQLVAESVKRGGGK